MGWGSQPLRVPCSRFPCVLALNNSSRVPLSHVAPMGLKIFVYAVCYKHAAPLGLNADVPSSVQSAKSVESVIQTNGTCRPSGALVFGACRVL